MKVLGLASYPIEAAATRYRLQQFVEPLAKRGIALTIKPFLNSEQFATLYQPRALISKTLGLGGAGLLRIAAGLAARRADVVLVQREAMIFGPPLIEWLAVRLFKCPMVLDLDDATYVPYTSPTYGKFGQALKWFSKTDDLIGWASIVTCGNRAIAEYAESKGAITRIIPTVVDTDVFVPRQRVSPLTDEPVVLGWIGTHSTFPYLRAVFPVLQGLAKTHPFKLKIVGAGTSMVNIPGVEVENLEWRLEREVADFQSFDVGLYPIDPSLYAEKWAAGKSGFKAIQYMAVGIPFVAAPVGAMAEIGEAGVTHFHATSNDEWFRKLELLLADARLRQTMGASGRRHAVEHYSLSEQADKLARALHDAAAREKTSPGQTS
ncbi:MAG TPA: glycosyltransferase family 4 protein [Pyrinomonadaceae bacterium]|nr:glycosyltransferase family 4 protein [Pyrinomonadaceae bacterium]